MREPGSRYIDFLIPGLLGMNLMGSAIWGMGFAIVDARRKKLLKRLVATPMPRHYYLLSFILSRLLLLVVEVGVVAGFGMLVFGVPMRGSLGGLAVLCVTGSLAFCALGLLIASRARTIEAASGSDEPGDDAHVDPLRRVLLRRAVSGRLPARDPSPAADRAHRLAARQHAAGRGAAAGGAAARYSGGLDGALLRCGAETVPMEVDGDAEADLQLGRWVEVRLRGADRDLEGGGHRSGGGFEAFFGVGRRALGRFEAAMVDDQAEDFRI